MHFDRRCRNVPNDNMKNFRSNRNYCQGAKSRKKHFLSLRIAYYGNSYATFQSIRLQTSGD